MGTDQNQILSLNKTTQMNVLHLVGYAGKDAETQTSQGGHDWCRLSIATDEGYYDKNKGEDGEWVKATEWHDLVAFRLTVKSMEKVKKGDLIEVRTSLKMREYTDSDGNKKKSPNLVVQSIKVLYSKEKMNKAKAGDPVVNDETPLSEEPVNTNEVDDDLPF